MLGHDRSVLFGGCGPWWDEPGAASGALLYYGCWPGFLPVVFFAVPAVGAFDDSRLGGHCVLLLACGANSCLSVSSSIAIHCACLDLGCLQFWTWQRGSSSSRRFWARDTAEATAPTRSFSIFRAAVASKALTTGHRRRGHASAAAPGQARSLARRSPDDPRPWSF